MAFLPVAPGGVLLTALWQIAFEFPIRKLKDKVAIVTGGSQGIGEAICYAYAREGAKVAVVNSRKPELGQAVAKKIIDSGGTAKAFRCNVSKRDECQRLVRDVTQAFGTVDILMNVAGRCSPANTLK